MDKKSRNTIIISIVALVLVLITVTYAYFSARITGLESASTISLTAGTLTIIYDEDPHVNMNNIYPREEEWVTKTFRLTGNNTTELTMIYSVGLEIETNTFTQDALTYDLSIIEAETGTPMIEKVGEAINISSGTLWFGTGSYANGQNQVHSYELKIYFKDNGMDQNDNQGAIFNAKLTVSANEEGTPKGWIKSKSGTLLYALRNDSKNVLSTPKTLPGRELSVIAEGEPIISISDEILTLTSEELSQTVNQTYDTGQEREICNSNYCYVEPVYETVTVNKYEISYSDSANGTYSQFQDYSTNYSLLENKYINIIENSYCNMQNGSGICAAEPGSTYIVRTANSSSLSYSPINLTQTIDYENSDYFSSTQDDYGTSYYYRGAVENNYLIFADMCWRIVRIDGLGNIKLVLQNEEGASCTSNNPHFLIDRALFNEVGENEEYKNTHIGYMYSNNPDSSDFNTAHANDNDSTILTYLKSWYDENLRAYNDKIADVIWCNDKSLTDVSWLEEMSNGTMTVNTGLGTDMSIYGAMQRLIPSTSDKDEDDYSNVSPSLVCPSIGTDGKLSKFTARDAVNGNAKLYSDNKEYKIGLLTADEVAFAGAGAYLERDRNDTSLPYYLYVDAQWLTLSPTFYDEIPSFFSVRGETMIENSEGYVRPSIALKSSVTITSGDGTSENPYILS